jgi:hypothetical protein
MMITKEEGVRGEILRGERFFVERLSPWTDFSEERKSSRRDPLCGETSPWREALYGEILQGETLSKLGFNS